MRGSAGVGDRHVDVVDGKCVAAGVRSQQVLRVRVETCGPAQRWRRLERTLPARVRQETPAQMCESILLVQLTLQ